MKIRYYISALGYDSNDCITDYDRELDDFDSEEKAKEYYQKIVNEFINTPNDFFNDDEPIVTMWKIQLEKCYEDDLSINCIDILAETNLYKIF